MRTSNKILLGGFIATILIIAGIHMALYAKYKRGDTTDVSYLIGGNVTEDLGNIKIVSITGMEAFTIIAADTARLVMDKHWKGGYTFRVNGDSLVIAANGTQKEYEDGLRAGLPVTLYLPPVDMITVKYGSVTLFGSADSAKAASQKIQLSKSVLQFDREENKPKKQWWNNLTIDARDNTEVNFPASGTINNLDVTLSNHSLLNDRGVQVETFSLKMDSASSAALHMQNLQKLKLNK